MGPQGWFEAGIRADNLARVTTASPGSVHSSSERFVKQLRLLAIALLALTLSLPLRADQASAAYKRGVHAESHNQYEQAYDAYNTAHTLKPQDAKYFSAYARMRFYVSVEDVRAGQQLLDAGKLQEALKKFQSAAEIDETNFFAQAQARQISDILRKQAQREQVSAAGRSPLAQAADDAGGPIELGAISSTLVNLRLTESSTLVYKTIGKLAGVNVLFDTDYKPQKINIELNDVTLREAFDMVAVQSKTFWQATSTNTILVAADTPAKRKEIQATSMKTFYLRNVSTPAELQEAANTLKGILDISRIQLIPAQNAMILRGTPDQMVLAQKLLEDIDKPKSEVEIDIAVLSVSRSKMLTLGAVPPTSVNVNLTSPTTSTTTSVTTGSGNSATGTTSSGSGFTLNDLKNLNATNIVVSIPPYSFTALAGDSNTKVLQKPQIWAVDNQKATLKVGDRIPIATGSFGASGGTQGYGALVNTQFQYIDVGVNIDITPHIHSDREVTLKMTLEISSVTGTQNIGGINQPTIGQRRIDLESRLRDGEVNLVGGILDDTETQSLSGYPLLSKIPILKYFFAQEAKQKQEDEIVFAITPHIVRSQEVTGQNLRLVDLGAGGSVSVRHTDPRKAAAAQPAATDVGSPQNDRAPATDPNETGPAVASPQIPAHLPTASSPTPPPKSLSSKNPAQPVGPGTALPPTAGTARSYGPP
jgi:general secretion pathway protein D